MYASTQHARAAATRRALNKIAIRYGTPRPYSPSGDRDSADYLHAVGRLHWNAGLRYDFGAGLRGGPRRLHGEG